MDKNVKQMAVLQEYDLAKSHTIYLKELKISSALHKLMKHKRRWEDVNFLRLAEGQFYLIRRTHPYRSNGLPVLASWKTNGHKGWEQHIGVIDRDPGGTAKVACGLQIYTRCKSKSANKRQ